VLGIIIVCVLQITFGGFMAGMRAGAIHTHWPIFAGDNHLIEIVTNPSLIQESEIINYEGSIWIKGVVQVIHRTLAGILLLLALYLPFQMKQIDKKLKNSAYFALSLVGLQYILGVLTIIGIVGNKTPVSLGVLHQGLALLVLLSLFNLFYWLSGTQKVQ
jgi:cytochrome c oxidase assembly protein subunit 15